MADDPTRDLRRITHDLRNVAGTLRTIVDVMTLHEAGLPARLRGITPVASRQIDRLGELVAELEQSDRPAPSVRRADVVDAEVDHAARCILLVDDDAAFLRLVALLLGDRGHDVVVARDSAEALTAARDHEPDVALVDMGLPGVGGIELGQRLREVDRDMTLVALTGDTREETRTRAREAGFDRYLRKGDDLEELLELLASLPIGRS